MVKADVVLASHEALVSDVSVLRAIPWEAVIIDERDRVPSALGKAYQAARDLEMRSRVVLQSSPLQQVLRVRPVPLGWCQRWPEVAGLVQLWDRWPQKPGI